MSRPSPQVPSGARQYLRITPNRPEADLLVGADRRSIFGSGIDREAVVSSLGDEVPCERSHRVATKTASLGALADEQVDSRVAIVGVIFFVILDQTDQFALELDCERSRSLAAFGLSSQLLLVRRPPPARYRKLCLNLRQGLDIRNVERAQNDSFAA